MGNILWVQLTACSSTVVHEPEMFHVINTDFRFQIQISSVPTYHYLWLFFLSKCNAFELWWLAILLKKGQLFTLLQNRKAYLFYTYIYIRIIIQVVKIFYKHFSFQLISVSCLQHFRLKDDVLVMIYFIIVACGWCCYCYQGRYISGPLTPVFIGGSIYNL